MKKLISRAPILAYSNPHEDLILENDANEYGLGAAVKQKERPGAYASRSRSGTERRYVQIEKEMLVMVYGLEKFNHYTHGRREGFDNA